MKTKKARKPKDIYGGPFSFAAIGSSTRHVSVDFRKTFNFGIEEAKAMIGWLQSYITWAESQPRGKGR